MAARWMSRLLLALALIGCGGQDDLQAPDSDRAGTQPVDCGAAPDRCR